jgi:hypothetical protein
MLTSESVPIKTGAGLYTCAKSSVRCGEAVAEVAATLFALLVDFMKVPV